MDYKCLVVDDEPLAHKVLEKYIASTKNLSLVGNCYNAREAKLAFEEEPIDILFLDIQMPEINGIHFLKHLKCKPITILTTAYRGYALDGFDLGVLDYLVKPIDFQRFTQAIDRAFELIALKKLSEERVEVKSETPPIRDTILVRVGGKKIVLSFDEITHLEGLKDYTIIYAHDKKHLIKGYIKLIETLLPTHQFVRVHKSFIVAKNRIKLINHNKIELNGFKIPIGRSFKKAIEEIL